MNTTYFQNNSAYSNESSEKFQLKQFSFFGPNLPKKVFPVKNRKISKFPSAKFQLKLIILSFWTKFMQKKVFPIEKRTSSPRTASLYFLCSKN